jgi:hypothetical protein
MQFYFLLLLKISEYNTKDLYDIEIYDYYLDTESGGYYNLGMKKKA